MAHLQQQQGPPQPYSPYQSSQSPSPTANSPVNGAIHFPQRRQQLSPNPHSPYPMPGVSPTYNTSGLALPTTQKPLPQPFNQPQPFNYNTFQNGDTRPRVGTMGPPLQPASHDTRGAEKPDRATDVNQLQDVLTSSGLDVAEEENYLQNTYKNLGYSTQPSVSFGSTSSATISPNTSFTQLSQGTAAHIALQGSGPSSQPAQSQESIESELKRKHEQAALARAQANQEPLENSFLLTNTIKNRIRDITYANGVTVDWHGLYERLDHPGQPRYGNAPYAPHSTTLGGRNGDGLVSAEAPVRLDRNASLSEIFSLIGLAANERIRGLLEDAYCSSRGRRAGADGVVSPEWADLAVGNGEKPTNAASTSITGTAWDQPPNTSASPTSSPLKRKFSDTFPSKSFASELPDKLRAVSTAEREAEKVRLKNRKARQGAAAADGSTPGSSAPNGIGNTGSPAEDALMPELKGAFKLTKKEKERQKRESHNEEVAHASANKVAQTAAFGKSMSKYSWMQSGSGAGSGASTPRGGLGVGTSRGVAPATLAGKASEAGKVDDGVRGREKRWGEWREDGEKGAGIQIRDWVGALEKDGKERRSLSLALARMNSRNGEGSEKRA
ncbi:MAG: hypothetical protein M1820_002326 [Bogoriella megaspora]|nr:MAG: hypothetical protein M1820_002326 [Bogoriella megaspora]